MSSNPKKPNAGKDKNGVKKDDDDTTNGSKNGSKNSRPGEFVDIPDFRTKVFFAVVSLFLTLILFNQITITNYIVKFNDAIIKYISGLFK